MTTKLTIYNGALAVLGDEKLATVTENRSPRRILDTVWDNEGVETCLEMSEWKFAMRTISITYSPSVEPDFGLRRAFDKPDDFVRTSAVCSDEYFTNPLRNHEYVDEAEYWFADLDMLYIRYVSNDAASGLETSLDISSTISPRAFANN